MSFFASLKATRNNRNCQKWVSYKNKTRVNSTIKGNHQESYKMRSTIPYPDHSKYPLLALVSYQSEIICENTFLTPKKKRICQTVNYHREEHHIPLKCKSISQKTAYLTKPFSPAFTFEQNVFRTNPGIMTSRILEPSTHDVQQNLGLTAFGYVKRTLRPAQMSVS